MRLSLQLGARLTRRRRVEATVTRWWRIELVVAALALGVVDLPVVALEARARAGGGGQAALRAEGVRELAERCRRREAAREDDAERLRELGVDGDRARDRAERVAVEEGGALVGARVKLRLAAGSASVFALEATDSVMARSHRRMGMSMSGHDRAMNGVHGAGAPAGRQG